MHTQTAPETQPSRASFSQNCATNHPFQIASAPRQHHKQKKIRSPNPRNCSNGGTSSSSSRSLSTSPCTVYYFPSCGCTSRSGTRPCSLCKSCSPSTSSRNPSSSSCATAPVRPFSAPSTRRPPSAHSGAKHGTAPSPVHATPSSTAPCAVNYPATESPRNSPEGLASSRHSRSWGYSTSLGLRRYYPQTRCSGFWRFSCRMAWAL